MGKGGRRYGGRKSIRPLSAAPARLSLCQCLASQGRARESHRAANFFFKSHFFSSIFLLQQRVKMRKMKLKWKLKTRIVETLGNQTS